VIISLEVPDDIGTRLYVTHRQV